MAILRRAWRDFSAAVYGQLKRDYRSKWRILIKFTISTLISTAIVSNSTKNAVGDKEYQATSDCEYNSTWSNYSITKEDGESAASLNAPFNEHIEWYDAPDVESGNSFVRCFVQSLAEANMELKFDNTKSEMPKRSPLLIVIMVSVMFWIDSEYYSAEDDSPFERVIVGGGFKHMMKLVRWTLNWVYSGVGICGGVALSLLFDIYHFPILQVIILGICYSASMQTTVLGAAQIAKGHIGNIYIISTWVLSMFLWDIMEYVSAPSWVAYALLLISPNFALRSGFVYISVQQAESIPVYGSFFRGILVWDCNWGSVSLSIGIAAPICLLATYIYAQASSRYKDSEGDEVLNLKNVSIRYSGKTVVESANLTVNPGDSVALEGPNGSGKSSLLRAMATGKSADGSVYARPKLLVVLCSQDTKLDDKLSAYDHMAIMLRRFPISGTNRDVFIYEFLSALNVDPHTPAGKLSGGSRRKALIAMCTAINSGLLLLDEPTNNIDESSKYGIWDLLTRLGGTKVVATHDKIESVVLCSTRLKVDKGALIPKDCYQPYLQLSAIAPSAELLNFMRDFTGGHNGLLRTSKVASHLMLGHKDAPPHARSGLLFNIYSLPCRYFELKTIGKQDFPNEVEDDYNVKIDPVNYKKYVSDFENVSAERWGMLCGLVKLRLDYEWQRWSSTALISGFVLFIIACACVTIGYGFASADVVTLDAALFKNSPTIVVFPHTTNLTRKHMDVLDKVKDLGISIEWKSEARIHDYYEFNLVGALDLANNTCWCIAHRAWSCEIMSVINLDREPVHIHLMLGYENRKYKDSHVYAVDCVVLIMMVGLIHSMRHSIDDENSKFLGFMNTLGVKRSLYLIVNVSIDAIFVWLVGVGVIVFELIVKNYLAFSMILPMFLAQIPFARFWGRVMGRDVAVGNFILFMAAGFVTTVCVRVLIVKRASELVWSILLFLTPPIAAVNWLFVRAELTNLRNHTEYLCKNASLVRSTSCCYDPDPKACIDNTFNQENVFFACQIIFAFVFFFALNACLCFDPTVWFRCTDARHEESLLDECGLGCDVSKRFRERIIIDKCKMHVNVGSHAMVVGNNGVGKSTLLNILGGYMRATRGKVVLKNKSGECVDSRQKNVSMQSVRSR